MILFIHTVGLCNRLCFGGDEISREDGEDQGYASISPTFGKNVSSTTKTKLGLTQSIGRAGSFIYFIQSVIHWLLFTVYLLVKASCQSRATQPVQYTK